MKLPVEYDDNYDDEAPDADPDAPDFDLYDLVLRELDAS